jgi:uncharacterized protein
MKVLKLATGQDVGELSRTSQCIRLAQKALGFAREQVRVVSIGVGEYPAPKLRMWKTRKWLGKVPAVKLLQKSLEINTQSMDQLRKVLYREVPTIRISNRYTQPEMATDMFEANRDKLNLIFGRP